MNASQRRIFRRALSASLGLAVGMSVQREDGKKARILQVSPTGGRDLLVKRADNRAARWPVKLCSVPFGPRAAFNP